jgi:hypothetical protein
MKVSWRIFTDCKSATAANRVVSTHFKAIGIAALEVSAAPYHKGGFIVTADTEHSSESWPHFVVEALSLAQKSATDWALSGNIAEELDAWSNSARTAGVSAMHIQARAGT